MNTCSVVLELLHEDEHTDKAQVTDTVLELLREDEHTDKAQATDTVLELLREDKHTDKAQATDTSINFPFQMCQNGNLLKKNNILNIRYVAYRSCTKFHIPVAFLQHT